MNRSGRPAGPCLVCKSKKHSVHFKNQHLLKNATVTITAKGKRVIRQ